MVDRIVVQREMAIFGHVCTLNFSDLNLSASKMFTVRNEVAKVMFLHLCVCPQGGVCLVPGGAWSRGPCPGGGGVPGPEGYPSMH